MIILSYSGESAEEQLRFILRVKEHEYNADGLKIKQFRNIDPNFM